MTTRTWSAGFLSLIIASTWAAPSSAQVALVAPGPLPTATEGDTVSDHMGRDRVLLTTGILTLGLSYGAAFVAAGESSLNTDLNMVIPLAGPWLALTDRGGCGAGAIRTCSAQTTESAFIIADGIAQAIGALMILGSLALPNATTDSSSKVSIPTTSFRLTPASMGSGAYGLLAVGQF
ncbi:MAG: hypothetical protein ACHREM_01565 [Polyangiales bacterium]